MPAVQVARAGNPVDNVPAAMLQIDDQTLREGLDRAADLLKLHRLSSHQESQQLAAAVYANFGMDDDRRVALIESLIEMVPISGDRMAEALMASAMSAGVLVGLLIANASIDPGPHATPDFVPADF
jgi:hypothetical protein